ncbi:MAG TPA: alpha/beta hydrolase-fold protein [Thermoanaerobaculia bacterium]|nr:alpha/beta hydrolase-fold protein [Thermoanaerobaculia bacterium]
MPGKTLARLLSLAALLMLPASAVAQAHRVTFVLDLRAEIAAGRFDPARDGVGVRGGTAPLTWESTLLAMDADGDGRYQVEATFPRAPFGGQAVAYKLKKERPGDPRGGWEGGRNRQLFLREPLQRVERAFDAPPEPVVLSRVGTIRRHPAFPSKLLPPREVQVYLPPGYERDGSRRYPVLYLQDGQHVFDGAEAGMEWQVDERAEALIAAGRIQPLIVVAVANTEARTEEYTPRVVEYPQPDGRVAREGGKADLYGRFLVEELKPFIDRTYRTRPEAASTAIGGASFGGLVSLWLALGWPQVFGQVLAVSVPGDWDDGVLLQRVAALSQRAPLRVWVDLGTLERESIVTGARQLRAALEAKGWKVGEDLAYVEQEGGQHDEISWASRVEDMLTFLFPPVADRAP